MKLNALSLKLKTNARSLYGRIKIAAPIRSIPHLLPHSEKGRYSPMSDLSSRLWSMWSYYRLRDLQTLHCCLQTHTHTYTHTLHIHTYTHTCSRHLCSDS